MTFPRVSIPLPSVPFSSFRLFACLSNTQPDAKTRSTSLAFQSSSTDPPNEFFVESSEDQSLRLDTNVWDFDFLVVIVVGSI